MKIYILFQGPDKDLTRVVGVFDDELKAQQQMFECALEDKQFDFIAYYHIESYEVK